MEAKAKPFEELIEELTPEGRARAYRKALREGVITEIPEGEELPEVEDEEIDMDSVIATMRAELPNSLYIDNRAGFDKPLEPMQYFRYAANEDFCFLIHLEDIGNAVEILLRFNDYESAGDLCESAGDHVKAAQIYEQGELYYRAAIVHEKMGNHLAAMTDAEKNGHFREAMIYARRIRDVREDVYRQLADLLEPIATRTRERVRIIDEG